MATEFINIVVAQRGAQQVRRELSDIGTGAVSADRAVSLLLRSIQALGAGLGVAQLAKLADGFTNLSNRLRLVSTDSYNLAQLQEAVFQAAQRTRTPFEALAALYTRTALNAGALGLSQQAILDLTESVGQSFAISGATAAEASGAIIQFTQGLAQGVLRGQELNSVLEQAPRLARAIAEGMGVGVYDLKRLGEQGKITAEQIVQAIADSADELDAEFARINPTIESAMTVLYNGLTMAIGQLDAATGASAGLANMLVSIGSNVDLLTVLIATVAGVLVAVFLPAMGAAVAAIWSFAAGATVATGGLNLLIPLLTALIASVAVFGDQIVLNMETGATLIDYVRAAFGMLAETVRPIGQFIMDVFGGAWNFLTQTWGQVAEFFGRSGGDIIEVLGVTYRVIVALFSGLVASVVATFQNLPAAVEAIFKGMFNELVNMTELFVNGIAVALNNIPGVEIPPVDLSSFKQELSNEASDVGGIIAGAFETGFAEGDLAAQRGIESINGAWDQLNYRAARERALRELADALSPNKPDGTLPDTPGVPVDRADPNADKALKEQERRLKSLLKDIKGPQGELIQGQKDLNILLERGAINQEEYNDKLRDFQIAALDAEETLGAGLTRGLMKVQDELANVAEAAENLVVNAFHNAEDALVDFITKGQFDFKKFVDSLIADMARLGIRLALNGLFGGFGGGGGNIFSMIGGLFGIKAATGGYVQGPGTGTSDSVPAMLSNGEFVVNAEATRAFLPLLHAINRGQSYHMATGGLVGQTSARGLSSTVVQVIDQRSSGSAPEVQRSVNGDGSENIRVIVRDEMAAVHKATTASRRREVRSFVQRDRSIGNL